MILAYLLLGLTPLQQEPGFNSTELAFRAVQERIGGSLVWVHEENWQLSLDVENKGRTFDLAAIRGLNRLYALRIFNGRIKEESLRVLGSLPNLHLLVFTSDGLTDIGARWIGKLKHVDKLDIKSDSLSSRGLAAIGGMKSLRRLFLYNTKITDSQIGALESMTWLQQLCLPMTVSESRMNALMTKLPSTRISRI